MLTLLSIVIATALVNNIVVHHLFGISPLLAASRRLRLAGELSLVMIYLLTLTSVVIYLINITLFSLAGMHSFRYLLLVLCIFAIIQLSDKPIQRLAANLAELSHRFKALLTMNSLLLAGGLLTLERNPGLPAAIAFGLGTGVGFALVLLMFTAIDARLQVADLPAPVKGLSIQLITLGLIAMAFLGFTGLAAS